MLHTLGRPRIGLFAAVLALVGSAGFGAPLSLTFDPASATIGGGDIVDVSIVVSGLDNRPPSLGAWDLTIAFDPSILSISDWSFGVKLGDPAVGDAIAGGSAGHGTLELAVVSLLTNAQLDALQTPSFTLATVQFTGVGPGVSPLTFSSVRLDDGDGNKFAHSESPGEITVVVPEPVYGPLTAGLAIALALCAGRRRAALPILAVAALGLPLVSRAQPVRPVQKVCVSVYRYGGAASGWVFGGAGAFPSGTLTDIVRHVARANEVSASPFGRPNVEWVWDSRIVEDLPDLFGNQRGDIEWVQGSSPPSDSNDRIIKPSIGGTTGSPDIDRILKDTADAECYPVVFVNGGLGAAGVTMVETFRTCPVNGVAQPCQIGLITFIDSVSFPRTEDPKTRRAESQISTLAHEFGHATCLDPVAPQNTPRWGDGTGHPPHPQGITGVNPDTPEGRGFVVPMGPADAGKTLRFDVMWFTGTERSGDERYTERQANLSNFCAGYVRAVHSPSFSVGPGEALGLDPGLIYYAPATPNMAPTVPVILIQNADIDGLSYGEIPPGRFPVKFSVDHLSNGIPGSAVAGFGMERTTTEFAAPLGLKTRTNIPILSTRQFGLVVGDQIDALEPDPPLAVDPFFTGAVTPPNNTTYRVYFSVAAGMVGFDPATIYLGTAENKNNTVTRTLSVFAPPLLIGLRPGDDIGGLCVADTDGKFDATDTVFFTLKRGSPTLAAFGLSSGDVFQAVPGGFFLAYTNDQLGLLLGDQISGLKCFKAPKPCDINLDDKVDSTDIQLIFDARGVPAGFGDPRDIDNDGLITVNDARICTQRCDKPKCAP